MKDKGEITTGTVHAGQINKTTTLPLTTKEEWRKSTSEDHDLWHIERILSSPEETPINNKEFINKGYVKNFQKGRLDMDNGLIYYYETPHTARVRQPRLRVVPVKFRRVVMSSCHVSPLSGNSHEQRTLFRILACFWWPMVDKEVDQFIKACAHYKLLN